MENGNKLKGERKEGRKGENSRGNEPFDKKPVCP